MGRGFWTRHFGHKPLLVLGAAALVGGCLGITLSWITAERQQPYPARQGQLTWTHGSALSQQAQTLLDLGRGQDSGPWNPQQQAQALRCAGLDIESTFLVSTSSQASQPDGWLSLPDVSIPIQVRTARGWLEQIAFSISLPEPGQPCQEHASWSNPQWDDVAQALMLSGQQDELAWQQAREYLRQSAQDQRLAQLVLSASMRGVEDLHEASTLLDQAGQRLRRATGQDWGLGLDGRIALFLVSADASDPMAGMSRTRPQTDAGAPVVDVVAEATPSVLLHEWFHGLDLVVAPLQNPQALAGMAWSNQRGWIPSKGPLAQAWDNGVAVLGKQQAWMKARRKMAMKERTLYWLDDSEAMAYAFELWASHDLDQLACAGQDEHRLGARPTPGEAACLAHAWTPAWGVVRAALDP